MKRTMLILACAIAAYSGVASGGSQEDNDNILERMDAEFNMEKLSTLQIRFRYSIVGKPFSAYELLLVIDSNKYYTAKKYDVMEEWDYTTKPLTVRTNYHPRALYEWCDGKYMISGCSDSDESTQWRIKNADGMAWWDSIHEFLHLKDWKASDSFRVIRKTAITNGVLYTCSAINGSAPMAEFTFSDADGNGIAPIKRVHLVPDGTREETEWSGWRKYGDIWIPSICKNIYHARSYDSDGNAVLSTGLETFLLLDVVSVNERISPRWFMPQFPAIKVPIVDETDGALNKYYNFDYNGNPYP